MKKAITTLALAAVMLLGSTFTFAAGGIIISDSSKTGIIISDKADSTTETSTTCREGIIVFGREGISIFGLVIGDDPNAGCTDDGSGNTQAEGIIVFG